MAAVRRGEVSASAPAEGQPRARIEATDGRVNAYRRARANARAPRGPGRCSAGFGHGRAHARTAAARRALRGQEPVRHRGHRHAGRLEDRARGRTRECRRAARAPARGGRRGAGRRAQHGRVRLRLHHREQPTRARRAIRTTSSASRAVRRRLGGGGGGGAGRAARWAPTPTVRSACRRRYAAFIGLQAAPSAGCRAAAASPSCSSLDHVGPFARSARDLALTYDAMQGPGGPGRTARPRLRPAAGSSRWRAPLLAPLACGACASAVLGGYFRADAGGRGRRRGRRAWPTRFKPSRASCCRWCRGRPRGRLPARPGPKARRLHLAEPEARRAHDFDPAVARPADRAAPCTAA